VKWGICFRIFDVMATGGMKTGATMDRAIQHLADTTDFSNIRITMLIPILSYLREITARYPTGSLIRITSKLFNSQWSTGRDDGANAFGTNKPR